MSPVKSNCRKNIQRSKIINSWKRSFIKQLGKHFRIGTGALSPSGRLMKTVMGLFSFPLSILNSTQDTQKLSSRNLIPVIGARWSKWGVTQIRTGFIHPIFNTLYDMDFLNLNLLNSMRILKNTFIRFSAKGCGVHIQTKTPSKYLSSTECRVKSHWNQRGYAILWESKENPKCTYNAENWRVIE